MPATTQTYTVELATATGANPGAWTDVTAYVMRVSFRRGRDDLLSAAQPGACSVTLDNADGRFSPAKTSSPLYPHVQAMRAVRVRTVLSGTTYDRFLGYVQSVRPRVRWDQQVCEVDLADGSCWLQLSKTTPSFGSVPTSTAVGTALDSASWPVALRNLDGAVSSVTPSYSDTEVLSQVNELAVDNEGGVFFFDGQGRATFHNRHKRFSGAYLTPQATFNATTPTIVDLVAERPARDIANEVRVTYVGGGVETETDATSQTAYGPRRLDINARWLPSQAEAEARAQWALTLRKDPRDRPVLTVLGKNNTLLTQILSREIGDRITVTGPTTSGVTGDFHIESVAVAVDAATRTERCDWQLSPASATTYFVLDDATRGQLNDDALAP